MKIYYIASKESVEDKRKKYARRRAFIALQLAVYNANLVFADDTLNRMDEAGETAFSYLTKAALWLFVFLSALEIMKKAKDGEKDAAWGILTKYGLLYGCILAAKPFFEWIGGIFQ